MLVASDVRDDLKKDQKDLGQDRNSDLHETHPFDTFPRLLKYICRIDIFTPRDNLPGASTSPTRPKCESRIYEYASAERIYR